MGIIFCNQIYIGMIYNQLLHFTMSQWIVDGMEHGIEVELQRMKMVQLSFLVLHEVL